jgi:GntR family transcriptional regulator/MocR family aminotransferase
MNTFTKTLASTVRISYMVLPPALLERYQRTLGFYSCTVPAMEQYTLARFLSEGYFETHVNRMRGFYRGRRDQVLDALSRSPLAGRYQVRGEDAGLHFLLRLETERDDRSLAFLSDYGGGESHVLVVSYPGIELARLPEALAHLAELL